MASLPLPVFSVEAYLDYDSERPDKHEFIDGHIVSMAGASPAHGRIAYNLSGAFSRRLEDSPCDGFSSDVRVCLERDTTYVYPDLTVVCGEPDSIDTTPRTLVNPTLLVEILSPSTILYDRNLKAPRYRACPTVKECLLTAQKPVHIEHWVRSAGGEWRLETFSDAGDVINLTCAGISVPVREIYRGVEKL